MKTFTILLILMTCSFISGCVNSTDDYIADLKNENIMVRKKAIYNLGKDREKDAVTPLVELLKSESSDELRVYIVEALGDIGESSSVDALIDILQGNNKDLREAAIKAMGNVKDKKAVTPLLGLLESQTERIIAIAALGNIGDPSAVPALTKLLNNPDKYVKYNAAKALKKIGESE